MQVLKLFVLFSFLFNIPFTSLPELDGPLSSSNRVSRSERTAHTLIVLEQLTTTTVKRLVTQDLAPLPDTLSLAPKTFLAELPENSQIIHNESLARGPSQARAPPV
ncbi:hypothetical protein [Peredibacter starrii]|uniref:Uncharacterized protein n=1 Tax=Peredibacter starrii TaxID=28202 RepID=A0AAX4HNB0_9BACT|nr:hypothetical protein [Peredibacter starrii]WPU64798.1 hypothetical protein SOO65_19065 [Peredibacter starrii]